jgi:hypothetical protein
MNIRQWKGVMAVGTDVPSKRSSFVIDFPAQFVLNPAIGVCIYGTPAVVQFDLYLFELLG